MKEELRLRLGAPRGFEEQRMSHSSWDIPKEAKELLEDTHLKKL